MSLGKKGIGSQLPVKHNPNTSTRTSSPFLLGHVTHSLVMMLLHLFLRNLKLLKFRVGVFGLC